MIGSFARWARLPRWAPRSSLLFALIGAPGAAQAQEGAHEEVEESQREPLGGRLDGDLGLSIEAGVSEAIGPAPHRGEALTLRGGAIYLQTAGLMVQYDEGLGIEALPMRRRVITSVEVRPLFWARFANDLERGPVWLDLFADSFSLALGLVNAFPTPRFCPPGSCHEVGISLGLGVELPLFPRANAPFIGLRSALLWSFEDRAQAPLTTGLLTLTLGYRHLLETHIVDAADALSP